MSERAPLWLVVAGVTLFVVFGAVWTKCRHRTGPDTTEADLDAKMNELNNERTANERRVHDENAPAAAKLPPDLSEDDARALIERCGYFAQPVTVALPHSFETGTHDFVSKRYPAMAAAEREHLIEFDPPLDTSRQSPYEQPNPTTRVRLTSAAYSAADIVDRPGEENYELGIGRRRIVAITSIQPTVGGNYELGLSWIYEKPIGSAIADDYASRTMAVAVVGRTSGGWAVKTLLPLGANGEPYACQ